MNKKVMCINAVGLCYSRDRELEASKRLFEAHKIALQEGFTEFVEYGEYELYSQEPLDFLNVKYENGNPDYNDLEKQLVEAGYEIEELDKRV
jgi:hypothetical protein